MVAIHTLGPDGSYSSIATRQIIDSLSIDADIQYQSTLSGILQHIDHENLALIPTANRYGGVVHDTMISIYQYRDVIQVIGWVSLKIHHCLAVNPWTERVDLKRVYSHPQGLAQCQGKLDTKYSLLERIATTSTTEKAASLASDEAVICSQEGAKNYGLVSLDSDLAPEDNVTHFALIGWKNAPVLSNANKLANDRVIAIISTEDKIGSLSEVLKVIGNTWLSLHFIVSMPDGKGGYNFPIVVDQRGDDLNRVHEEIRRSGYGSIHVL